ncbi:MAG: hypothetical protein RIS64_1993 [Bacteroidota bacterium]|jgi:GLPGLI family protein
MKYLTLYCLLFSNASLFAQSVLVEYNRYQTFLTGENRAMIAARSPTLVKKFENEYERFELITNARQSKYRYIEIMYKDTLIPRGNSTRANATIYLDCVQKYVYHIENTMPDKVGRDTLLRIQDWKIATGEKEIAGYSCKKAMGTDPNGYEIIAWFTLDIPIQQGPAAVYGLPGLVLGVESKNYNIFAHKVQLLSQVIAIKMPIADTYLTLKALGDESYTKLMETVKRSKKEPQK